MELTKRIETGLLVLAVGVSALCTLQGNIFATTPAPSQAAIMQSPNQNGTEVPAAASDTLARSQELLLKARHSLMSRDINSALRLAQEAEALNAPYREVNDRPEYVLPLIRQYQAIEQAAKANGLTEKVKRDFARNYLDQAEALRRCRDFDNADSLVVEARKLNVYLDSQSIQKGMDFDAVAQRIRDDRTALAARRSTQMPAKPLVGLSDAMKQQIAEVQRQLVQARGMLAAGQMDRAEELARRLQGLGIPENAFAGGDSPIKLLGDIATTRSQRSAQASQQNTGAIRQVQGTELRPSLGKSNGYLYVQEAEAALRAGNKTAALKNFQGALRYASEMDAQTVRHINESITRLNAAVAPETSTASKQADSAKSGTAQNSASPSPAAGVASGINFKQSPQQIQSEISAYVAKTNQIRKTNPKEALAKLVALRKELEASSLDASMKGHFSFSVDMAINETNKFIAENGPMIELDNQNKDVEQQVRQKREEQLQIQQKLAEDVEKYNRLMEEGKYDEAIILAKKCQDYSHDDVVAIQMYQKARTKKQVVFNENLKETRANGWLQGMNDVETASVINISDDKPVDFGPRWDIVKNRTAIDTGSIRSEADMEILNKLNVRITLPFDQPMPLATVMEFIGSTSQINVLIDNQALTDAGVTSDMAVETKLSNITLKNYLKHILEPYNLTYIVDDEVLKITSKNKLNGKIKLKTYSVADLVTGIPNFNGLNSPFSMEAQFDRAFNNVSRRGMPKSSANTIPGLSSNPLGSNSMVSPDILAQIASAGGGSAQFSSGSGKDATGGMADPSELITLITTVIDPESWEEVGDPQYFSLTNALAIRQTEENHEEIRDLLEKLRSMLDLQIAVEVRFITISDEYFERIGVNFNVSFKTDAPATEDSGDGNNNSSGGGNSGGSSGNRNSGSGNNSSGSNNNNNNSGGMLSPAGKGIYGLMTSDMAGGKPFTENLNINFSQNSYGMAIPQFGNYDPTVGAQMGFAILSDIESYFFMTAAEADRRSNILQAPKVTMFNGQWASVMDYTQVPYVYTVIPVVGEFAVSQQPVVTVINEGQFMTVQAVASEDRRFVRVTVAPYFSKITDKDRTFKFEGSDTIVTSSTSASKGSDESSSITDEREDQNNAQYVSTGTTVQQPIVTNFSVMTTVKVPDGGTVLLGGIKRLSEGRNEGGVPILDKIPYLKRLFTNSAIGRETTSLMMMVTPRIIIQEEEEEYILGGGNIQ